MNWFKELKKSIKGTAVIAVLSLFSLIVIFYLLYIHFVLGEQLDFIIPEFYHVFTITFAIVAAIVALSNYLLRREDINSKNSLDLYNYYENRLASIKKTEACLFEGYEVIYNDFEADFHHNLDTQIKNSVQFGDGDESDFKQLKKYFKKSEFRSKGDYEAVIKIFEKSPTLQKFFESLHVSALHDYHQLGDIPDKIDLLRKLFVDYNEGAIKFHYAELLVDKILDLNLISFLRFTQNYYLIIPYFGLKGEVWIGLDLFRFQQYSDVYIKIKNSFKDLQKKRLPYFIDDYQEFDKEFKNYLISRNPHDAIFSNLELRIW